MSIELHPRVLEAKALRRLKGYGEQFDQRFIEEFDALRASGKEDEVLTAQDLKKICQALNPQGNLDMIRYQETLTFLRMADFSGGGTVTANECKAFFRCMKYFDSLG